MTKSLPRHITQIILHESEVMCLGRCFIFPFYVFSVFTTPQLVTGIHTSAHSLQFSFLISPALPVKLRRYQLVLQLINLLSLTPQIKTYLPPFLVLLNLLSNHCFPISDEVILTCQRITIIPPRNTSILKTTVNMPCLNFLK